MLRAQLEQTLKDYVGNKPEVMITCKDFPVKDPNKQVIALIDESDKVCQVAPFLFNNGKLGGLYGLRNTLRTVFLTATCTKFMRDAINAVADKEKVMTNVFQSKAHLSGLSHVKNSLFARSCATADEALAKLIEDMKEFQDKKPMIFFTDGANLEDVFNHISGQLNEKLYKCFIKNEDDAMQKRKTEGYQQLGLYMLHESLARGFDLKLLRDAHVFILAREKDFALSDVTQMIGRGCRSFGVAEGFYYSPFLKGTADLERVLESYEPDYMDGPLHLKALYGRYSQLTTS